MHGFWKRLREAVKVVAIPRHLYVRMANHSWKCIMCDHSERVAQIQRTMLLRAVRIAIGNYTTTRPAIGCA